MSALPRARCPVCGADVALRVGGRVREHKDHRHELYATGRNSEVPTCEGRLDALGADRDTCARSTRSTSTPVGKRAVPFGPRDQPEVGEWEGNPS